MRTRTWAAVSAVALALGGCGSGGSISKPGDHSVTIAWQANHEKGVNGPGGGYRVAIPGRPTADLRWDSGTGFAPTSLTTVLYTGTYGVTVTAYQPAVGGTGTATSNPASLTVVVP